MARSISTLSGEPAKRYSRGSCSGYSARDVSDDFVRVTVKPEVDVNWRNYKAITRWRRLSRERVVHFRPGFLASLGLQIAHRGFNILVTHPVLTGSQIDASP
jgi:hypothetical protein